MNVVNLKSKNLPDDPICETPTFKRITVHLELTHERGAMARIIGSPGLGKTTALRRFKETMTYPERVYLVTATSACGKSMNAFANMLAVAVGTHPENSASKAKINIDGTLRMGKRFTILVDEAQKLGPQNVELLREIHDEFEGAVVLCGNKDIASRYGNLRGAAFAQIESRTSYRLDLERSQEDDIRSVCEHQQIGNARSIAKLIKLGTGPLGLRIVADVIEQTRLFIGDRAITPSDIDQTTAFMGVQQ